MLLTQEDNDKAAVIETLRPDFIVVDARYLSGGLSNRCLKLTAEDGRQFVWRPEAASARAFGLSRSHEFNALKTASEQELAAPPVKYFNNGLLNPWVDGFTLENVSLETIVSLQARVHGLPPLNNCFDPFDKGAVYFNSLEKAFKSPRLIALHRHFQAHRFSSGLELTTCHYDLGYYNLVQEKSGGIKILDWEYAAFGDPALDLVMTSLANGLELETLVDRYCHIRRIKAVEKWQSACVRWQPVADYLGALWYALGFQLYGEPLYQKRGDEFLAKAEASLPR